MAQIKIYNGFVTSSGNMVLNAMGATSDLGLQSGRLIVISQSAVLENNKTLGSRGSETASVGYISGFDGSGWRLDNDLTYTGQSFLGVDNLTVRGNLKVYELMINQIRASNGSFWFTDTGKVVSASGAGTAYTMSFDTSSNLVGHGFSNNDIIRHQKWDYAGSGIIRSDLKIDNVINLGTVYATVLGSTNAPSGGFEYVRIGNTTNTNRQGAVYITSTDDNAPYIDVINDVDSYTAFNQAGKVKTRIGKLSGVTSNTFGTLTGYGLWASGSAYLEGGINATSGLIGGWIIDANKIYKPNTEINSQLQYIKIGDNISISNGIGTYLSGSGEFNIQAGTNEYIRNNSNKLELKTTNFDLSTTKLNISDSSLSAESGKIKISGNDSKIWLSTGLLLSGSGIISSSNLYVDSVGNLTASNAILSGSVYANNAFLSGVISSSAGNIGGWGLYPGYIQSGNMKLSGSGVISSSNFYVNEIGNLTASNAKITGEISSSLGNIGGWTISPDSLYSSSSKWTKYYLKQSGLSFENFKLNLTYANTITDEEVTVPGINYEGIPINIEVSLDPSVYPGYVYTPNGVFTYSSYTYLGPTYLLNSCYSITADSFIIKNTDSIFTTDGIGTHIEAGGIYSNYTNKNQLVLNYKDEIILTKSGSNQYFKVDNYVETNRPISLSSGSANGQIYNRSVLYSDPYNNFSIEVARQGNDISSAPFSFGISPRGATNGKWFKINPNGYVGINKTNPTDILDVSGSVLITGSLNVSASVNIKGDTLISGSTILSGSISVPGTLISNNIIYPKISVNNSDVANVRVDIIASRMDSTVSQNRELVKWWISDVDYGAPITIANSSLTNLGAGQVLISPTSLTYGSLHHHLTNTAGSASFSIESSATDQNLTYYIMAEIQGTVYSKPFDLITNSV